MSASTSRLRSDTKSRFIARGLRAQYNMHRAQARMDKEFNEWRERKRAEAQAERDSQLEDEVLHEIWVNSRDW